MYANIMFFFLQYIYIYIFFNITYDILNLVQVKIFHCMQTDIVAT